MSGYCRLFLSLFFKRISTLDLQYRHVIKQNKTILFILLLALVLMIAVWLFFDWRIRRIQQAPLPTTMIGGHMLMDLEGGKWQHGWFKKKKIGHGPIVKRRVRRFTENMTIKLI
jgi:hypothetical protein